MEIKKDILWRVYLSFLGIALLGVAVIGRAMFIQTAEGKYWKSMGDSLHVRIMPVDAQRGSIYSEDGNMLSTSVPIFDVYIDFGAEGLRQLGKAKFEKYADSLAASMAALFAGKDSRNNAAFKRELLQGYQQNERYYPLIKKINFVQFVAMREFPLIRMGKNKSGFIFKPRDKRINPYGLMAGRTIGLSRDISSQNVGLEQSYDSFLRGKSGEQLMRYIAGAYMPVEGMELEPENGKDIVTTIDTYIQDITEKALMDMLVANNSIHGSAIVMETATGKIKAIANLGQSKNDSTVYLENLNYGVGKATEPGSVFKLATLLALMEDKYVTKSSMVDCEGGKKSFANLIIRDAHLGMRSVTVKEAFMASSNVAFAKLADQYYSSQPEKFVEHLHRFRLDQPTGIDITAKSGMPTIKSPKKNRSWSRTTIPYMAHGYEELVTPLHMLMLYNAVANGGKMMKPYLVNSIREYGVEVKRFDPVVLEEKICSDETLAQARECMQAVVDSIHGTAHKVVFDSAYRIAGKTGTAVTALDNKGYNKGNKIYQASFIGFFPVEAPKYTIAVVIQNSRKSKLIYGADVSGRVFKQIADKLYSRYIGRKAYRIPVTADSLMQQYLGTKEDVAAMLATLAIRANDSARESKWRRIEMVSGTSVVRDETGRLANLPLVPNTIGMGLKDAVYLAENNGLKVKISGKGRVVSQSLTAGTPVKKGQELTLFLN